jgi:hypothetical protein
MFNFLSTRKKGKRSGEKGQALILVLCLIALGSLLLTAMLGLMGSGTKSSRIPTTGKPRNYTRQMQVFRMPTGKLNTIN